MIPLESFRPSPGKTGGFTLNNLGNPSYSLFHLDFAELFNELCLNGKINGLGLSDPTKILCD